MTELLQTHLDGQLKNPSQVLGIVRKHQPSEGLDNSSWTKVTEFIMEIEFANVIPKAKVIAEKYNLSIVF